MVNRLRWNVLQLPPHSIVVSMTPGIYLSTYKLHANPSCSGPMQHHHHHYHPPHQTPARHHLTSIPENNKQRSPKKEQEMMREPPHHSHALWGYCAANAKYADAILPNQAWCRSSTAEARICIGSRHRKMRANSWVNCIGYDPEDDDKAAWKARVEVEMKKAAEAAEQQSSRMGEIGRL